MSRLWTLLFLALSGCAEQREFWRDVEAGDQMTAVPHDYGAGEKPEAEHIPDAEEGQR